MLFPFVLDHFSKSKFQILPFNWTAGEPLKMNIYLFFEERSKPEGNSVVLLRSSF